MLIRFIRSAERDVTEALDWYLVRSEKAAERFANDVDVAVGKVSASPERFPYWDDRHQFLLLRRFPYYVAYRIETDHALIVAVRHTSLDEHDWTLRNAQT